MLKMYVRGDQGQDIVMFGLSAMNLVKLQENLPIVVDMAQFRMQGRVVIGCRANEDTTQITIKQPDGTPSTIVSLSAEALTYLQSGRMLELDLAKTGRPGKLLLFYGTDEETMAADLRKAGIELPVNGSWR